MSSQNGFEDALKQMKTLLNVNEKVAMSALEEAAEYFAAKLKGNIDRSKMNKSKHLKDQIQVKVEKEKVTVLFGEYGWYWYLVEHGHKKRGSRGRVKGKHFVQKTLSGEEKKLEEIMTKKIYDKMEG